MFYLLKYILLPMLHLFWSIHVLPGRACPLSGSVMSRMGHSSWKRERDGETGWGDGEEEREVEEEFS